MKEVDFFDKLLVKLDVFIKKIQLIYSDNLIILKGLWGNLVYKKHVNLIPGSLELKLLLLK